MFLLRAFRKFLSFFRSQLTGHEVGMGFCLGILLGCIPLSSVWAVVAVVSIMVLFRGSFIFFFLSAAMFKGLSLLLAPMLFSLGRFALEGPLSGLFAAMVQTPVLALLDLHRYLVAGAILFFILASALFYPLLFVLTKKIRPKVLLWADNSAAFARFKRFPLIKLLTHLVHEQKEPGALQKYSPFRNGAVILLASLFIVVWGFGFVFGDALAKSGFETGLSRASNSDVTTRDLSMSLLMGSLSLEDMIIYKEVQEKKVVHALKLYGDLSMSSLLRKRFVFEELVIENMDFKVARDRDGNLNLGRKKPQARYIRDLNHVQSICDYLQQDKMARELVNMLLDLLFNPSQEIPMETKPKGVDYGDLYADALLEQNQPAVAIDSLWIKGLFLHIEDDAKDEEPRIFKNLTLHATNLSSNPGLYGKDCVIRLGNNNLEDPTFLLTFTMNWSQQDPSHVLEMTLQNSSADQVAGIIRPGDRINVKKGEVSFDSKTIFKKSHMESLNTLTLSQLEIHPSDKKEKILGVKSGLFCTGLTEFLKDSPLRTTVTLKGPYEKLSIQMDEKALVDSMIKGVERTGKRHLQEELNTQLNRLDKEVREYEDRVQKKLDKKADKILDKLNKYEKGLEGLFGGKSKKKKKDG